MSNGRVFLKYWLPVALWMAVIFAASTSAGTFQHSSRIIGPLLHWFFPNMAEGTVNTVVFAVRKCAHMTEYAVLALLLWRAMWKPQSNDTRPWSWPTARNAILFTALYAMTDEIHQLFVADRQGQFIDVVIDTTGATLGLVFNWLLWLWRKKW